MKHILLIIACCLSLHTFAQVSDTSALYKTIKAKDSLLFDIGFNTCNLSPYDTLIADDFKFYHDKGGITNGKAAWIKSMQDGICKMTYKADRQLVAGTLRIFPLENNGILYGAIETGDHAFFETPPQGQRHQTGQAKFTLLWLLTNGHWQAASALSYDHQAK